MLSAEHHLAPNVQAAPCTTCTKHTLWRCMTCDQPTCFSCSYSQFALCQSCKANYVGELWALGKRADEYIRAEFERVFQC